MDPDDVAELPLNEQHKIIDEKYLEKKLIKEDITKLLIKLEDNEDYKNYVDLMIKCEKIDYYIERRRTIFRYLVRTNKYKHFSKNKQV